MGLKYYRIQSVHVSLIQFGFKIKISNMKAVKFIVITFIYLLLNIF